MQHNGKHSRIEKKKLSGKYTNITVVNTIEIPKTTTNLHADIEMHSNEISVVFVTWMHENKIHVIVLEVITNRNLSFKILYQKKFEHFYSGGLKLYIKIINSITSAPETQYYACIHKKNIHNKINK